MKHPTTRPPVVTRSIRPTGPEPWALDTEAERVVREARERRRWRSLWTAVGAAEAALVALLVGSVVVVVLALVLSWLSGCAGQQSVTARDVLDAAAVAGRGAEEALAAHYRDDERACLGEPTSDAARDCMARVDASYADAWAAYAAFLAAWRLADAAERAGAVDALPRALAATAAAGAVHP